MLFEVFHVMVLCAAFPFVCLMNQNVESVCVQITLHNSLELLFMKSYKLLHSFAELIQASPRLLANEPGIESPLMFFAARLCQYHVSFPLTRQQAGFHCENDLAGALRRGPSPIQAQAALVDSECYFFFSSMM